MKPIYLEFCGINSFSQKAVINFEKLLSGGVFGIFGATGSGKSTILDSIHLALYGKIDRAVGAQNDCINYRLDSAYVLFDFEIAYQGSRRIFRAHRERKRKASGNKAHLYEKQGEAWLAIAEGPQEVDDRLAEIIGLSFDDFKKCIALPQGEFSALVKSTNAERMKLVSRLFDLEKYGDNLSRTVRSHCESVQKEMEILVGRLQENEGGKEEHVRAKEEELLSAKEGLKKAKEAEQAATAAYERAAREAEEKSRFEALRQAISLLEKEEEKYQVLQTKAEQAAAAKELLGKENARQAALQEEKRAEQAAAAKEAQKIKAEKEEGIAAQFLKESGLDEKIWRIEEGIKTLRKAQNDFAALEETKKKYEDCRKAYAAIVDDNRDFDTLLKETEKELEGLGEENSLEEYVTTHLKGALLQKEYSQVREDLRELQREYPVTEPYIQRLLQKYRLPEGESITVEQAKKQFDEREKRRRQLSAIHADLLSARTAQIARSAEKSALTVQGKAYKAQMEEIELRLSEAKSLGDERTLVAQKEALVNAKAEGENKLERARKEIASALAEREKQRALCQEYARQAKGLEEELQRAFPRGIAEGVAQASAIVCEIPDAQETKAICQRFFATLAAKREQQKSFEGKVWQEITPEGVEALKREKDERVQERERLLGAVAGLDEQVKTLKKLQEKYLAFQRQLAEKKKQFDLWDELRTLVKNNQFLDFIASEYLQEICIDASQTLLELSSGRYYLCYEGEFRVGDNLDGGNLRAVKTLSGGETFLVSLSLALSLSNAICQKSMRPIEFFFLDEGFGTLDGQLVDTVMNVLGKLIGNHFAIGLISHVEELKQRIENKVLVTGATETKSSEVKVIAY